MFSRRSKSDAQVVVLAQMDDVARVLTLAQQTADAAIAEAQRQADEIIAAARREADVIRAAARAEASGTGAPALQQRGPDWLGMQQVAGGLSQPDEPSRQ